MTQVRQAAAIGVTWDGGAATTDYNTDANWNGNGGSGYVPASSFQEWAIIGTTASGAMVDADVTLATTPPSVGGIQLGVDAGSSGVLTISAGTLDSVTTGSAAAGGDGRVLAGVDGYGNLTMTGGTLNATGMVVTGGGGGQVNLSGSSVVNITGTTGTYGLSTFGHDLTITGPDVDFYTQRDLRLQSTSVLTEVITSPTAHSPLKTDGNAYVGGSLAVEFSGAGATHSLGTTWDLVDAAGLVVGGFSNLGVNNQIDVTGLAAPTPTGAVYRVQSVDNGGGGEKVQLVYDQVLVLHVNRDTQEISITNPLSGTIAIDGYSVRSTLGSLLASYDGISGATSPPDSGWVKPLDGEGAPLNSANALTEVKQTGTYDVSSIGAGGVSLGDGFDREAVAGDVANFGTDGEDLIFDYTYPDGSVVRGQVEYEGTPFLNNLIVRVNPDTGEATIKNDSLETLDFDGYAIRSSAGDLDGTSWTGLGGTWDQSPATTELLSETNLIGSLTLSPGQEQSIGQIASASALTSDEAQAGLSLEFILSTGLESVAAGGDYNGDGSVDAADYTVWRDNYGQSITLANENPDATTPGVVDDEDYDYWKAQFGTVGGYPPETEFRPGSIYFDTTLGASGSGALAATSTVPEPGTGLLLLSGLASLMLVRRGGRRRQPADAVATRRPFGQLGGRNMSRQFGFCLLAVLGVCVALFSSTPAQATTQGISLDNYEFELPGPEGTKVVAFDATGDPIADIIPGWTFPGPGVEDFGHEDHEAGDATGDSGTEGSGNPGNELLLADPDGIVYQVSTFNALSIPSTQQYKFAFDAHEVFTIYADGATTEDGPELTVRYTYGAARTTLATQVVHPAEWERFELTIPYDSTALAAAIGQPLGVEFDTTSTTYNADVEKSWVGVDNVVMEITGALPGDLNGDGAVDLDDYAIVRDNQQTVSPFEFEGDLTDDNYVNLNDFRAFKEFYAAANAGAGSLDLAQVPEPSSLVLMLIVAVALAGLKAGRSLSRLGRLPMLLLVAVGVGAMLAASSPAVAAQLAYDGFKIGTTPSNGEYTVGLLAGQNPDTGSFFSGAWHQRTSGNAPNAAVLDTGYGLSYIGAPAEGGATGVIQPRPSSEGGTVDNNARIARDFADPWTDSTAGTYYLSFLVNYGAMAPDNLTGDMGYRTVEFYNPDHMADLTGDADLYVGYNAYAGSLNSPDTARISVYWAGNGSRDPISNSPLSFNTDGATHLVVMKAELSADAASDNISFFLDPITIDEPALPGLSIEGVDFTLGTISSASIYGSEGQTDPVMDEIRVGETYIDVLPELPVPGDADGDGDVDLDDYTIIIQHMNQTVAGSHMGDVALADGSQGADGKVTLGDFRIWKDHYPYPGAGAAAGAIVPEPSSLVLVLVCVAALAGWRRRTS